MTWNTSEHRDDDLVWVPCGTCWGQRTLFTPTPDRGGLIASACPSCMGMGERLAGGDHIPAPAA